MVKYPIVTLTKEWVKQRALVFHECKGKHQEIIFPAALIYPVSKISFKWHRLQSLSEISKVYE